MKKLRFFTWYWGNYCVADEDEEIPFLFELYCDEHHGWHNSEEYKLKGEKNLPCDRDMTLKEMMNSSHYKTMVKEVNECGGVENWINKGRFQ